ncbi:hypothetical protein JYG23_14295 [Sedimentibacter sp. zth1]|uniref:hypothetical protein n=1 Tax=Sedimentibacter sp. zth1 TaxID=2816908 RepID=UPI001A924EAA|nr:hypothetical protein [Sedimentibacter sp. zth1]QSX05815.1 hypothetical protein JYG23_14295 [Sedimentibacter sp. zth1]
MKAYDLIKKIEFEVTTQELISLMKDGNRQVELTLNGKQTDDVGYLTWDKEHWTTIDANRFMRCYSLEGKSLMESTAHNIYDLQNDFHPELALKIEIN